MSWDFNYRINSNQLVTASGPARFVTLEEGIAGKRAEMVEIAYRHGVYVASRHWTKARLMNMTVGIYGGTPADIYTSKKTLINLFSAGVRTLQRIDPNEGEVQCEILVSDEVSQPGGSGRFEWVWPVWQLRGYWEDAAATSQQNTSLGASANLTQIVLAGTHPVEPVITIDCNTAGANPAVEDPATGDKLVIASSLSAADTVVIDVPARTVTLNGTRVKNVLTINRGHWMEFAAGATVDLDFTSDSGNWDVTVAWRDRYRG